MKKYNILVLTDHSNHSEHNSIYAILKEMLRHEQCDRVDVASRGLEENKAFFEDHNKDALKGVSIKQDFCYTSSGRFFYEGLKGLSPKNYDVLFLRLPRPVSDEFLLWIDKLFDHATCINDPKGILETSNKQFLLHFPALCPDIRLCHSISDVLEEAHKYPIVLKPLKEYGGKGLLKITGDLTDDGNKIWDTELHLKTIEKELQADGYLSMRFLKNVSQGDKRILVANGEIMAASLRMPKQGAWLCNVAQGGTSVSSEVTAEEIRIVENIKHILLKKGIFMCGVDTLVDDEGKRVLSEINTLSIGGWPQAEKQCGKPIINLMIKNLFTYVDQQQS